MNTFLKWFGTSPVAAVLKIAVSGLLVIVFDSINSYHLPAGVALVITAFIPVVVDYLNPHDARFGKGAAPSLVDFLQAYTKVINAESANSETPHS